MGQSDGKRDRLQGDSTDSCVPKHGRGPGRSSSCIWRFQDQLSDSGDSARDDLSDHLGIRASDTSRFQRIRNGATTWSKSGLLRVFHSHLQMLELI